MPNQLMNNCEQQKPYLQNGAEVKRWVVVEASTVEGVPANKLRCMHCFGAVRVYKQRVPHGPQDHVEHKSRQDSRGCLGGVYFEGEHRASMQPVT
jgi:hypothetical protein